MGNDHQYDPLEILSECLSFLPFWHIAHAPENQFHTLPPISHDMIAAADPWRRLSLQMPLRLRICILFLSPPFLQTPPIGTVVQLLKYNNPSFGRVMPDYLSFVKKLDACTTKQKCVSSEQLVCWPSPCANCIVCRKSWCLISFHRLYPSRCLTSCSSLALSMTLTLIGVLTREKLNVMKRDIDRLAYHCTER